MAEGQDFQACREIFVGGRARALLNAIAYFENERGQEKAGRDPNLSNNNNNEGGVTRQEMGLPCGRTHALRTLIPGLGVSHCGEGGAEASLSQHPPHHHTSINPTLTFG